MNEDGVNIEHAWKGTDLQENARPFDSENYQFAGIIEEEMGTFLAGERSAEDTAVIIQSRIGLYLKETR